MNERCEDLYGGCDSAALEHPGNRIVVVSPHLDDAVLSLGSTVAHAVQAGAKVEILTVFSDSPVSQAEAGPWDSQCGFATEGEAAAARREEDQRACAVLGAEPHWLDFGDECYEPRGSDDDIYSAVTSVIRGADAVLIPGFPLVHCDHARLSSLLLHRGLDCPRVALYGEQPYMFTQGKAPTDTEFSPMPTLGAALSWRYVRTRRAHRRTKYRAARSYRSQLYHLGLARLGLHRMLWREAVQGGEPIVWLS